MNREECHGNRHKRGKRRFPTREAAETAMSVVWLKGHAYPGPLPCRVYLCACGYFHLSTRPYGTPDAGEVRSDSQPSPDRIGHHARIS